jgi:hypothetical protein
LRVEFNGLDLADDSLFNITSIDGLDSLPDLTIGMAPKPRRHGSWLGGKLAQKRVITIGLQILGDPSNDYRTTKPKNALVNALQIMDVELPLIFELDYGEQPVMVYASVTALDLPIKQDYSRHREATIEFTCTDPMKYAAMAKQRTAVPPSVPEATPYGAQYGFAYSVTTGLSGAINADNEGNSPAPAIYKIRGPITRPTISLSDSIGVRTVRFNVTLKATDELYVSTAANRVLVNGADNYGAANGALVADLVMRPGTTVVTFTGDDTGGPVPPSLTVEWRDATR